MSFYYQQRIAGSYDTPCDSASDPIHPTMTQAEITVDDPYAGPNFNLMPSTLTTSLVMQNRDPSRPISCASPPPPLGDKLRLYHVEMNPYGHRVLLILEAKKAKYEVYKLDPLSLPEWFRDKNPRLKIPVLEIPTDQGDKFLFESVVICDYLDEKYARNPLHSRDPYVKAQDRLLIERFNELIKGSLECFDTNFAFGSEQILQTLDIFEKELANRGTNYFGGNRPGMLDYMIWPWVERLYLLRCVNERKFDEKRSIFPNFADWGDQMQLDEVVKKHANSPVEYFDYYKNARAHSMGYYL